MVSSCELNCLINVLENHESDIVRMIRNLTNIYVEIDMEKLNDYDHDSNSEDLYVILDDNILNTLDLTQETVVYNSNVCYEEDGTAGAYEGSGYGFVIGFKVDVKDICIDNGINYIPFDSITYDSSSYSHCSCYGASTACDIEESPTLTLSIPGFVDLYTRRDSTLSKMANNYVKMTCPYELAECEAFSEAWYEVFDWKIYQRI